jgi:hypothetical protein
MLTYSVHARILSHEGVVFLDFLPSPHLVTSFLFPYLGSTDALCSRLGDPVPLPPRWRPYSQGPPTLPYWDPEHVDPRVLYAGESPPPPAGAEERPDYRDGCWAGTGEMGINWKFAADSW